MSKHDISAAALAVNTRFAAELAAAEDARVAWVKAAQDQLEHERTLSRRFATQNTAMATAIQRVRDLHTESLILDECDHDHPWDDVEAGTAYADEEIGVSCNIMYRVCRECCISEGYQTEDCANGHRWHHGPDGYRCRTLHALEVPDAS